MFTFLNCLRCKICTLDEVYLKLYWNEIEVIHFYTLNGAILVGLKKLSYVYSFLIFWERNKRGLFLDDTFIVWDILEGIWVDFMWFSSLIVGKECCVMGDGYDC